jgi:hypothetical protein
MPFCNEGRHYSRGIVMHLSPLFPALALAAAPVFAQAPAAPSTLPALPAAAASAPTATCPAPGEVRQAHMLGLWRAEFQGLWQGATLLLEKHPEYAGSLRGAVNRNGEKALLAGDVDKGEFTLEESDDGKRISAVWLGDVVAGSCGKEIRGTWQEEKDPPKPYNFVLRKLPN